MLKRIHVNQLRLGMHLHKLEGNWIQHPFWKSKFVIRSEDDLRKLHACGIAHCWIDDALGLDVDGARPPAAQQVAEAVPQPTPQAEADAAALRARALPGAPGVARPLSAELQEASAICERGRAAVLAMFSEARLGKAVDAAACAPLVDEITQSVQRNPGALVSLARLKRKDDYSYMHSVAVCALMVSLARQLGQGDEAARAAGMAGLVHDIGKALMPEVVLNKPGRLTDDEFAIIRTHPLRGHDLLVEGNGATAEMLQVALHHHEKVDGSGYPHRLAGDAIGLLARMGAVCDVYDAITSNRPYKAGWDPAESIARMASWAGHFDKTLFAAFVQSLGIYPTGSVVKLASGKLAVVTEQNPQALTAPVVNVFYSTKSQMRVPPQRIDLAAPHCADRIVGRASEEARGFAQLDELWADSDTLRRMHH